MNRTGIEGAYRFVDNKIIIRIRDRVCESADELISSQLFKEVLSRYVSTLIHQPEIILKRLL